MNSETVQPCPMCGRIVSAKLTTCPGCGERIGEPDGTDPDTVREADFRHLLNLLGLLWIGWSLIGGCAGLMNFAEIARATIYLSMVAPTHLFWLVVNSLTWFVSGLAALQREMWGVYLGHVYAYLMLAANLFYVNPIGIFVAAGFILFSRLVLKQYRQLKGSVDPSDDE